MICISYSPVEYEPAMWNSGNATLVHIDVLPAYEERNYTPDVSSWWAISPALSTSWRKISIVELLVLSLGGEILRDHNQRELDRRGTSCPASAAYRSRRHAGHRQQRRPVDRGHGQLPYLDYLRYLYSFARQVMISKRPADHGRRRPALGHRRLAGQS